jgi:hypothetical protein
LGSSTASKGGSALRAVLAFFAALHLLRALSSAAAKSRPKTTTTYSERSYIESSYAATIIPAKYSFKVLMEHPAFEHLVLAIVIQNRELSAREIPKRSVNNNAAGKNISSWISPWYTTFCFKLSQLRACSKLAVARQLGDLAREAERQLVAASNGYVIFFLYIEPPHRLTTRYF